MEHDGLTPPVLVDGLNVAYWCGAPPSLRLPLALATGLLGRGDSPLLIFDASTPYQLPAAERDIYSALLATDRLAHQVPGGQSADAVLLAQARATGGCIISRDRFRAHHKRYRSIIHDARRRTDGWVVDDLVQVPGLELTAPLPASCAAAWEAARAAVQASRA